MKYNVLGYLIGEGFGNVLKNKKSTMSALIIMCASMIIFGIFLIIGENINYGIKDIESEQGMQVFIDKEASEKYVRELKDKIQSLDGVSTVEFISKEDALNQMKERFGDQQDLLDGYEGENNIFTESYFVKLTDLNMRQSVQDQISTFDHIKKITSSHKTIEALIYVSKIIKGVTAAILILIILISIFIISNTIKLTVHARRKEISIMKYVGATNGFIRWPFIVEGMIIGVVAGLISIIIVGTLYTITASQIVNASSIPLMNNLKLVSFSQMFSTILIVYLLLGIGVGAIGSIVSMRKYLKV